MFGEGPYLMFVQSASDYAYYVQFEIRYLTTRSKEAILIRKTIATLEVILRKEMCFAIWD